MITRRIKVDVDVLLDKWLSKMLEEARDTKGGRDFDEILMDYDKKIFTITEIDLLDLEECCKVREYFAKKLDEVIEEYDNGTIKTTD